jgi:nucleotide-binding universal stress UspA family protein
MYTHILFATDGSAASARAEQAALAIARAFKAQVTAVHVVEPPSGHRAADIRSLGVKEVSPEQLRAAAERRGNGVLQRTTDRAKAARVRVEPLLLVEESPGEAIANAAKRKRCDLIVMGTNAKKGLERLILGSVAAEVLERAAIPVLVSR